MVSVLLGVIGEVMVYMLWDRMGLSVVVWGGGKRWEASYMAQTHPHEINHKFTRPSSITMLGVSRSAKMDSQFLRNLIFIPLTKVASAHRSIHFFQMFLCHMIDETFSHPYIWTFPQNV